MGRSTIIETRGLTKRYGPILAVDHLNLSIRRGEVFGLLGPNGAGKTTTTLMLLGLTEPTEGTAFINGKNSTREPIAVKSMVGYLPDQVGFYPDMTGRENLWFTGRINGLTEAVTKSRADEMLRRVGMEEAADRAAGTYSRGMRQRLGIADVLMKDPQVIIMDEPTLGIDPEGIRQLIELIRRLADEDGRTILLSSHQLYQVQQICDRVGIFVSGRLAACGTIPELGKAMEGEIGYSLWLKAGDMGEAVQQILAHIPDVDSVTPEGEGLLIQSHRDVRKDVTVRMGCNGIPLLELRQKGGDLDEIYRRYFEKAGEQDEPIPDASAGRRGFSLPWRRKPAQRRGDAGAGPERDHGSSGK